MVEGIPLPTPTSLFFYGPVELAPGRIFNNVYIPSAEDRAGDYSQCGYIIDPLVGVPFAGGYISQGRLFVLYAFRIGVPSAAVPEPSSFTLVAAAIGLATVFFAANLPQNLSRTATMANSR